MISRTITKTIDATTVNQRRTRRFCFAGDLDGLEDVETEVDTGTRLVDVRAKWVIRIESTVSHEPTEILRVKAKPGRISPGTGCCAASQLDDPCLLLGDQWFRTVESAAALLRDAYAVARNAPG